MKVIKPYIRSFKGVPIYISWFVIYRTKFPVIKTRALEIKADVYGKCVRRIMPSVQKLDLKSFFSASIEFLKMMFREIKEINPSFFEDIWLELLEKELRENK